MKKRSQMLKNIFPRLIITDLLIQGCPIREASKYGIRLEHS